MVVVVVGCVGNRTRKVTTRTMLMLRRLVPNGNLFLMCDAPKSRQLLENPI